MRSDFYLCIGLDPAGPMFEKTTKEVRIDKSDASFVDIIHCNGGNEDKGFLGINAAVGHADFFPNGGHHVSIIQADLIALSAPILALFQF